MRRQYQAFRKGTGDWVVIVHRYLLGIAVPWDTHPQLAGR